MGPDTFVALASGMAFCVLGFIPSLAGPGYLSSLVAGLLLPSCVAITAGLATGRSANIFERAYLRALRIGFTASLGASVALFFQGLRVGMCDPSADWLLFALGPATGSVAAGAWGAFAGLIAAEYFPRSSPARGDHFGAARAARRHLD